MYANHNKTISLKYTLYNVNTNGERTTQSDLSFEEFNKIIAKQEKYNIFINGSDFIKNYSSKKNIESDIIVQEYVSTFLIQTNNVRNIFTCNISILNLFRQETKFFFIPKIIPKNTIIAINYNKTSLLVFFPDYDLENNILPKLYSIHRNDEFNIYISMTKIKTFGIDKYLESVNIFTLTPSKIQKYKNFLENKHNNTNNNTLKYSNLTISINKNNPNSRSVSVKPTKKLHRNPLRSISNNPNSTNDKENPLVRSQSYNPNSTNDTKENPLLIRSISYNHSNKTKKRISTNLMNNTRENKILHDFDIVATVCKNNDNCEIGLCTNNKCEHEFSATNISSKTHKKLFSFNKLNIFKTEKNIQSIKEFYNLIKNNEINLIKIFSDASPEITNNVILDNIDLPKYEVFIDFMNLRKCEFSDELLHRLNIIVTVQSYKFDSLIKNIKCLQKYKALNTLKINDQIINIIIFDNNFIVIVTPSPSTYKGKYIATSLEIDDYLLYYFYTKFRNPDKQNVYLSNDNLDWVIPKNHDEKNRQKVVNIIDIFVENNDLKISDPESLGAFKLIKTYDQYLEFIKKN